MEFWKHLAEGKGLFLPEELELPFEDTVKTRNKEVSEQEPETRYDASNCSHVANQESLGGQEFIELGFSDSVGRTRQYNSHAVSNSVADQFRVDLHKELDNVSREKQIELRISGSIVEPDGIDLKLGESSKEVPSMPTKRTRLTSLCSQTPTCQVHGCNKDLSSSKDYYKRHKVCDAHTKTAKVIVKGIEQRFCQQCSRFHLLAEFDDGKRSCRKRLANHNERRRKPPGARFLSSSMRRTSFPFEDMLPTAFPGPSCHEPGKWFGHVKLEDTNLGSNSLLNFRDNTSVGTLDRTAGIAVPSDRDFSHVLESSRALSLLSAQPLKVPDQLHGTAVSSPMTAPLSHHNYVSTQGLSYPSVNSDKNGPSGSYLPDRGVDSESNTSDSKHHLPSGQGNMVDLLQLSSHLQVVEQKKNSMR